MLPRADEALDRAELERIGTAWVAAKELAPNRAHPGIPRRPPGNLLAGIPLFFMDRVRDLVASFHHTSQ